MLLKTSVVAFALLITPLFNQNRSMAATSGKPLALAAACLWSAPPAVPPSTSPYTITDVGAGEAMAISNNGKVAGTFGSGSNAQAFLWEDGVVTSLGTLGGSWSRAYGVNDNGQVAGTSLTGSGHSGAFLWQKGSMKNLGTLGGNGPSGALAINNAGQVVGFSINSTPQGHAFLWDGGMTDLGALSDGASYAYAISDTGMVAGWGKLGTYPNITEHAFRWNGSMQDLGTGSWVQSSARGINDNGDVVGRLINEGDGTDWHAALSQNGGGFQDLGGTLSTAYDINNDGLIVGESGKKAVLWKNGQMKDLNSLIPANSGWGLLSANAINNNGQIVGKGTFNGQAHAFLLKPREYKWINPNGGSWHVATNWDPQGDPGKGDTAIFDLNGQYAVDASVKSSVPVGRLIVSGANVVDFQYFSLNLLDDSVDDPALTVNDAATVKITSGSGAYIHAILGGKPAANPSNPPVAHLQVFNNGTSMTGSGRLSIGDEGQGDLFVANGGYLSCAEARVGGLLANTTSTAVVGGDGSLWETGIIAVGYGASGFLTIENGGRVNSTDGYVSWGTLSEDSNVIVNGLSANGSQPSMWALLGSLFVGQTWFGSVEVLDGGDLFVSQNVQIKNGELNIEGRNTNGDPSDLDVLGSVFVGGAGIANLLALRNGAKGDIEGDLIIGKDGKGAMILWGSAHTANPTWLDVVDPAAGLCVIGHTYDGGVSLDDGGLFRCRNIQLGQAGMSGVGYLKVDGGMVRALEVLKIGQVGGGRGQVDLENNALVATNGTYITANGTINLKSGTATLAVGFLGLQNDGTLALGVNVLHPKAAAATPKGPAQHGATILAVSGNLAMGPAGRLEIPLIGKNSDQYGKLAVSGSAALNGVLALNFHDGYAPQKDDTFTFLTASGGINGTFAKIEINGLQPGFLYDITSTGGQVVLKALNDGVPLQKDFLSLWTVR
ncbi:hypothetical protein HS121_02830 [bacterium]|nr:hypothetical protein [bacterium]